MASVIFTLPALLLLCDKLIRATTVGMKQPNHPKISDQEVM